MFTGIIYKYTSSSGKIYIGQSTREKKTRRLEFLEPEIEYAGAAINNARKKYGPSSFTYEILVRIHTQRKDNLLELLNIYEAHYIKVYNSKINGYNETNGGDSTLGYKHSEETKFAIANSRLGKKHSEETKTKIRESNKDKHSGKRPREWYEKRKSMDPFKWRNIKVYVYDTNMNLVKTFINIKATANFFGCGETTIRRYLKSSNPYKGFIFKK